jgi:magnesium and cobalt transporter
MTTDDSDPADPAPSDDAARSGLVGRLWAAFSSEPEEPAPQPTQSPGLQALRRIRVEDVAIPKAEIEAVPADIGLADLVERFRISANTRLPVFEGTLDTPIGMVHLKDIALAYGFEGGEGEEPFDLRCNVRPLLYAPPSMPIDVLLAKMQADRTHMALVIDEYGGVDGLLTLEDLIEQVIGEIEDEHDIAEGRFWTEEKPGTYIAQSRAPLSEFEAEVGRSLVPEGAEEEPDTLGGLVFVLTGRVPARGEVIPLPEGGEIEVVDADPRRIKRLRLRMTPAESQAAE